MNQKQREYALFRVKEIEASRLRALENQHLVPEVLLTDTQKWDLVKQGVVQMRTELVPSYYTKWYELYDFKAYEKKATFTEGYLEAAQKVSNDAQYIKDRIMLGDAEEAIRLIESFEEQTDGLS